MFPLLILTLAIGGFLAMSGKKKSSEPGQPQQPATDDRYYFYYEVNERARDMIQALLTGPQASLSTQKLYELMRLESVQPDLIPPGYVELNPSEIAAVFTDVAKMPISEGEISTIQLMALAPPLAGVGGNTIRIHPLTATEFEGAELVFAPASVVTGVGFAPGQIAPGVNDLAIRRVFRKKVGV